MGDPIKTITGNKYSTPLYDNLRPRYQLFLDEYCIALNGPAAARHASYKGSHATLIKRSNEILSQPEVHKALKELMEVKHEKLEQTKASMIARVQIQATVTISDLAKWCEVKDKWVMRSPKEVDDTYKCCMSLVTLSREGQVVFNQGSQDKARKALAELLLWDQAQPSTMPVHFDFSGLKTTAYIKNDKKITPDK